MTNQYDTFEELQIAVAEFVKARGWKQFHNPKNLVMAIAVEAGELMELLQWIDSTLASTRSKEGRLLERLSEELADVIIYCASLANVLGVKMGSITAEKLSKDSTKFSIDEAKRITTKLRGDVT